MPAGNLDRRIIIEQPVTSTNGVGETITTWQQFAVVWAAYSVATGTEMFAASQRTNERRVIFDIRFLNDVTNKMRVVYDGEEYEIENITELGRRDMLRLTTSSREVKTGAAGA